MKTDRRAIAAAIAISIAAPAEGLRQVAYYDPPGILTVCRGHTGPDVVKGKVYTIRECDAFMDADMREAVAIVDRCQPGLPVAVLAAFSDAVFNLGPTIVCNGRESTASRLLTAKRYEEACAQLPRWDKARILGVLIPLPGLTARRALEMRICLGEPL